MQFVQKRAQRSANIVLGCEGVTRSTCTLSRSVLQGVRISFLNARLSHRLMSSSLKFKMAVSEAEKNLSNFVNYHLVCPNEDIEESDGHCHGHVSYGG